MQNRLAAILIPAAAAALFIAPAFAQDIELPSRKSGQWEISMIPETPGAMPQMTVKACIDEASDRQMMEAGFSVSKSMCPQQSMKREGDSFVIDSVCQIGPMTTTSHIVVSGDFQSAYTVTMTSTSSGGPPAMAGGGNMTQQATWVGADCTDGMTPGEMLMPGGMKVNVNEMMKTMGGG
jgi:hypothetical protein